jgi:signal transduction histidine kinase
MKTESILKGLYTTNRAILFKAFTLLILLVLSEYSLAQQNELIDSLRQQTRSDVPDFRYNAFAQLLQQYAMAGNIQRAISIGDSLVTSADTAESSLGYIKLLSNLGICYRITGQFDSAARYLRNSYLLAEREGHLQSQALTMISLSSLMSNFNQYDSSITLLKHAIPILEKLQDSIAIANAYNNLGNKYSTLGDYGSALRNQFAALNIYEALAAWRNYQVCLISLGNTYKNMNDLENSIVYYQRALEGDSTLTDEYLGNIHVNWAESLLKMDQPEQALEKLNICMTHWHESNCLIMYPLAQKAQAFLEIGELDSVKYYAEQSIFKAQTCKERSVVSANQLVLGRYYAQQGMLEKSQDLWERAYSIADSVGRTDLKRDISNELYLYYKGQNEWRKALSYLEIFKLASDSLLNEEQIQNTAKLETEFAFEKDKKELQYTIDLEQARADQAVRQQTILIILALVVFVSLIVVVYLINRNRLNERKSKIKLNEKNEQLEALNHAKEKIISLLSHDIRNPLFGLEGSLNMLIEGGINEADFKKHAIQTKYKLRGISDFLDNLLKWARNQLTGLKLNKKTVDGSKLIQETIDLFQSNISSKALVIHNHTTQGSFIRADYDMIQTVVRNVLANAIKYTPEGKGIYLDMEKGASEYVFVIRDEGIGIKGGQQIFELGATFEEGTEGETGTGLGLALAKEFVEKHNGRIWTEQAEPGTVVKFSVPIDHV